MAFLYGLVDASRDERLYPWLAASQESRCLFEGKLDPAVAKVAPYIVRLREGDVLLEAWRTGGAGQSWGIQCVSELTLPALRRHFRHFLQAKLPTGMVVLFRFYDPRVWRVYLPTCDRGELGQWFKGVDEFRCEGLDGDVLRYILRANALDVSNLSYVIQHLKVLHDPLL